MATLPSEERLVAEAHEAAQRLRRHCVDFPDDQFGNLVFHAALIRLKGSMDRDEYERLRRHFERDRSAFLARLRPRAD